MKHFIVTTLTTIESLKQQYRELAKKHHPDKGGNAEAMKEVNLEYVQAIKMVASNENCSQQQKEEANELLITIINELKIHYPTIFGIISMFNQDLVMESISQVLTETFSRAAQKGKETPAEDVAKYIGSLLK